MRQNLEWKTKKYSNVYFSVMCMLELQSYFTMPF